MPEKTATSSSKTAEQTADQMNAKTSREAEAKAGRVELDHGDAPKKDKEPVDPWGDTPLQMRDAHSPEVDPANNDAVAGTGVPVRSLRVNPMEPGEEGAEQAPEGGTNAPA